MEMSFSSVFFVIKKFLMTPMVRVYLPVVTLVSGIILGYVVTIHYHTHDEPKEIRENENIYQYINPLLECEMGNFLDHANLNDLESDIKAFTEDKKSQGSITMASVYYRDLNNGPWFGIEQEMKFSPASLIKVPLMIAYLRESEVNPSILTDQITITENVSYEGQNILPKALLTKGLSYSVEELIERMVIYSDNVSYDLLLNHIDSKKVEKIYNDMGIDIAKANNEDPDGNIITVKEYASFFRVLFNSSYLSPENSEKALALMTKSEYKQGLVAGIDPSVEVAHKYGERFYTFSGIRQLHDCGIVYHPKGPYLLCVMTRGKDLDELSNYIEAVSEIVYKRISVEK
jgi:beta-lactamase class A